MVRQFAIGLSCLLPGAAMACLLPQSETGPIPVSGADLLAPNRYLVAAGGDVSLPCEDPPVEMPRGLQAHVSPGPDAVFELDGMAGHILAVRAFAGCSVRLIVNTGQGAWVMGEALPDPAGSDHGEELYLWGTGDGLLRVWLGAEDREGCPAEVELETYDQ